MGLRERDVTRGKKEVEQRRARKSESGCVQREEGSSPGQGGEDRQTDRGRGWE